MPKLRETLSNSLLPPTMQSLNSFCDNRESNPVIVFVNRDGSKYMVTLDNVELITTPGVPQGTHYYCSDSDISRGGLGRYSALKEFNKRLKETGGDVISMPSLTPNEMMILFMPTSMDDVTYKFFVTGVTPVFFVEE